MKDRGDESGHKALSESFALRFKDVWARTDHLSR